MRRLSICLCAVVLSISLGACGRSEPQHATSGPSLTVNVDLTIQLKGHRVTTINLLPLGHPSGGVALKAVHDGHLVTIGSQRFFRLNDPAYLVVQVSARDIELGWNIPQAAQDAKSSCAVAFPAGSSWAGAELRERDPGPGVGRRRRLGPHCRRRQDDDGRPGRERRERRLGGGEQEVPDRDGVLLDGHTRQAVTNVRRASAEAEGLQTNPDPLARRPLDLMERLR